MPTLIAEKYANRITTKGNRTPNSNLKKWFENVSYENIYLLNNLLNIKNNMFFKELNTDLVNCLPNTVEYENILQKYGYVETIFNNFDHEEFNFLESIEEVSYIKNKKNNFVETVNLKTNDGNAGEYVYFKSKNYILFADTIGGSVAFYYNFEDNYEILDFKITKDNFVYLLYKHNSETFFVKTHLGMKFCSLNEDNISVVNEDNFITKIKVPIDADSILTIEYNDIYLFDKSSNKISKLTMSKRYYFFEGDKIYFNLTKDIEERFRYYFLEKDSQLEFLNMYNYLNFLGLNDYKIVDDRKISTKESVVFDNLFKLRFDNTLNGSLNFFNSKRYNFEGNIEEVLKQINKLNKDYVVNFEDEYFSAFGNFCNEFKKGEYKIVLSYDPADVNYITAILHKKKGSSYFFVKSVKSFLNKNRTFYFCNLKITFKKREFIKYDYSFDVTANDTYTFLTKENKNYKIEELPNSEATKSYIKDGSTIIGNQVKNKFVYYNNGSITFENYFDSEIMRFKFHNNIAELFTNKDDFLEIDDTIIYQVIGNHYIKNNKIYPRGNCVVHYSLTKHKVITLVDDLGYITDLWKEHEDSVIFVKESIDEISIVDNLADSHWSIYIPSINSFFLKDDFLNDVKMVYSDDYEVVNTKKNGLMVTNKFFNKPLFYKVFVEDCLEVQLFRDDGVLVSESLVENYNDGKIIYFNKEEGRIYYANTEKENFLYLNVMYAHSNIETSYTFKDSNELEFDLKRIDHLKISTASKIGINDFFNVLLYNTFENTVFSLEFNKEDFDTSFSIGKYVNKIVLEFNSKSVKQEDIVVYSVSNNSNEIGDKLVFNKENLEDVVYTTTENCIIDDSKIDLTRKIKVNEKYTYTDGYLTSSYMIVGPLENDIYINENEICEGLTCKIYSTYSYGQDDFYENNFKSPGAFYKGNKIDFTKALETINDEFNSSDII